MRRSLFLAVLASLAAACVTMEPPPDPRGAVKAGQRMIVMVNQSPGPWIVADPDSKAETALKLLPLGTFLEGIQEDHINAFSKEIQPYLPRPHYAAAVESGLIAALKLAHSGPVQNSEEAGITPAQRRDWNAAADQLDWRQKYYFADLTHSAPRDYTKLLNLDDAVILDVNLSFGLEPDEQDRTLPILSATARLYRADTGRMLWGRETRLSDTTSSETLTEFRATPPDLTDRIYALSAPLASRIALGLSRDVGLMAPPHPLPSPTTPAPGVFVNGAPTMVSTAPFAAAPAQIAVSSAPVAAPPPQIPISTGPPAAVLMPPGVDVSSAPAPAH